jgi:hypothetical protein
MLRISSPGAGVLTLETEFAAAFRWLSSLLIDRSLLPAKRMPTWRTTDI